MKHLFLFMVVLRLSISNALAQVNLADALQQNSLEASIAANPEGTHYVKPLRLTLKNKTTAPLNVKIEAGTYFIAQPTTAQDIIATEDMQISLAGGATQIVYLHGLGTEADQAAGDAQTSYQIGNAPKKEYTDYARFVAKEQLAGTAEAQFGMWVLSNARDMAEVYGYTEGNPAQKILTYLNKVTKQAIPPAPKDMLEQYYKLLIDGREHTKFKADANQFAKFGGKFSYDIGKPTKVQVAIMDAQGVLIREIYYAAAEPAGKHTVEYTFDASQYRRRFYQFKLITDGRLWNTMKAQNSYGRE